ncbi:hypothetical protein Noc_0765 [Nitrosococcus oceani ATCC 19707]|uniref:Uncharacterized protein n=2 Tax=Nitrosococcus oceani TaxID=1229 RepID=Q3JD18_NITOC|nr:hypothetical protein [Nitrosococcus oceani]ABA57278.1 hypothetical protein Noc_0765 [Nitrosococcus oceani ATCC 19707]EDZ67636.1 hypothetical protein NOC27_963 [Nitrosococcus oceani AFC27]KFI20254.1 hypothetical protein IB75_03855 [Nitrosococcus oceani C-27]GEM20152.1 hypothetical protein NONS58_15590 [Nitrosococcus oceani]
MKSRYFLALAALVAAQSSSGFTVILDGDEYRGVNNIEIVADESSPTPPTPPTEPVDPPFTPDPDPNTPPVPNDCPVPAGLTVLEENIPKVLTTFKIRRNQAVALAFDEQHFRHGRGQIQFTENTQGPSPVKWAVISSCPGDFTVVPGCSKEALTDRILVDFTGRFKGNPKVCSLEPGETYYFNIRHFDMTIGRDSCPKGKTCALYVRP